MAKPMFTIDQSKTETRFEIAGDLTVQYAPELKSFLLQALEQTGIINLVFDKTTSMDTASVQITYAVKKELEKRGRQTTLSFPKNESVMHLLTKTGITKIL